MEVAKTVNNTAMNTANKQKQVPENVKHAISVLRREGKNNYQIISMCYHASLHPLRFTISGFAENNDFDSLMQYLLDSQSENFGD
jgi:hypothetical protein